MRKTERFIHAVLNGRHERVVANLHRNAHTVAAHADHVAAHVLQQGQDHGIERLVAPDEDAERTVDRGRLGLDDGRIRKLRACGLDHGRAFERDGRVDRAHVDADLRAVQTGQQLGVDAFDVFGLGHHRDDDVRLFGCVGVVCAADRADLRQFVHL